ncbi:MAG: CDP-glucose 4,6-dehydratase [Lachnospiraceae bacterium]|nr:CDP-glucose 4,6-dehydratase [Lachnospiraceae bacterium]
MNYKGKKVLLTGHTGFKGSWMTKILLDMGAEVCGYSMESPTEPGLFQLLELYKDVDAVPRDVRDLDMMMSVFAEFKPEIVIHMAAQPIVRESYRNPVYTYETNVMGTVNVLECIRKTESVKSFVNVTTDKVYRNKEWAWGYRENEELNGHDPYSNSKSCSELVTSSYVNSFFGKPEYRRTDDMSASVHDGELQYGIKDGKRMVCVSTCRAGNVIGGGDFATDRILPDCVRAAEKKEPIIIRNPYSIRPYQHVLEPVITYLELADRQLGEPELAGSYNIGPEESDCITTGELADLFCKHWMALSGEQISWINRHDGGPHEASFLKLDCSMIKSVLGWKPTWDIGMAVEKSVEWYYEYKYGRDIRAVTERQIKEFLGKR